MFPLAKSAPAPITAGVPSIFEHQCPKADTRFETKPLTARVKAVFRIGCFIAASNSC